MEKQADHQRHGIGCSCIKALTSNTLQSPNPRGGSQSARHDSTTFRRDSEMSGISPLKDSWDRAALRQAYGMPAPRGNCSVVQSAEGQNRSCLRKWAAKQEKLQPLDSCFSLYRTYQELTFRRRAFLIASDSFAPFNALAWGHDVFSIFHVNLNCGRN